MSENLSKANFSAANSGRKGLYFSSDAEVLFDANAMGCRRLTSFPPGSVVVISCASTPANASLHPSVVSMNRVPSYHGAESIGSDTRRAFRDRKVSMWLWFQISLNLNPFMILW